MSQLVPVPNDALPLAAYVCTDRGADVARAVVHKSGGPDTALRGGGLSGAARLSSGQAIARTLITEIGNITVSMACESISEIRKSGAEVIVLGQSNDLATYRALRQAGALEYFAFPVTAEEIMAIQTKPVANDPTPLAPLISPCIAVMGSNGGVGASLLAQNLAFHAAASTGKGKRKTPGLRTGLIDADLQFGTQAIDLDLDDTPGLLEALSAPDRIDSTFIDATMYKVTPQLSLYSYQARSGQEVTHLETALPRLSKPLRKEFDALVLDLPRRALLSQPKLAEALDMVVLVIPAGFAGVNAASRLIARLKEDAPGLRILPVLSELRRDAGLSRKEMVKALEVDMIATLPRCDALITKAQRAARPMVQHQPRSPYSKTVAALWQSATSGAAVVGAQVAPPAPSRARLKRIFG